MFKQNKNCSELKEHTMNVIKEDYFYCVAKFWFIYDVCMR
jgi:hypothetical protein